LPAAESLRPRPLARLRRPAAATTVELREEHTLLEVQRTREPIDYTPAPAERIRASVADILVPAEDNQARVDYKPAPVEYKCLTADNSNWGMKMSAKEDR